MSSFAAMVAFLEEELNGILDLYGGNLTVSGRMTAWVGGMYMS